MKIFTAAHDGLREVGKGGQLGSHGTNGGDSPDPFCVILVTVLLRSSVRLSKPLDLALLKAGLLVAGLLVLQ